MISLLKRFIPDREMPLKIMHGPFRGGVIYSNPQYSLRKIFGLYEHELNNWLTDVLPHVDCVVDVGANDGYFTFGCAAALQRMGKKANIVAYEPLHKHVMQLKRGLELREFTSVTIDIIDYFVSNISTNKTTTLDALLIKYPDICTRNVLVKIDVEGAEIDVINGGLKMLKPENYFLIEVHKENYLKDIKSIFSAHGLSLVQINQRPLPLLGYEHRDRKNWWLVSRLTEN